MSSVKLPGVAEELSQTTANDISFFYAKVNFRKFFFIGQIVLGNMDKPWF
jgi:hypothetical protein